MVIIQDKSLLSTIRDISHFFSQTQQYECKILTRAKLKADNANAMNDGQHVEVQFYVFMCFGILQFGQFPSSIFIQHLKKLKNQCHGGQLVVPMVPDGDSGDGVILTR